MTRFDLLLARRELALAIAKTQNPAILAKLQAAIKAIDQSSILPPPPEPPPPFLGGVTILAQKSSASVPMQKPSK